MPAEKAPKRYAIKGRRPGEVYHHDGGVIETNPIDGGAALSEKQKAYFDKEYGTIAVADVAPVPPDPELNDRAKARIAENAAVAASAENEALRVQNAQLVAEKNAAANA